MWGTERVSFHHHKSEKSDLGGKRREKVLPLKEAMKFEREARYERPRG